METITIGGKEVQIKQFELQTREIIKEYFDVMNGIASWKSDSKLVMKYLMEKQKALDGIDLFYRDRRNELDEFWEKKIISDDDYSAKLDEISQAAIDLKEKIRNEIPQDFFFESTWKLIVHRGVWPFRKPFRSYRKMIKQAERPELMNCVKFIGEKVLGFKTNIEEIDGQKKT